MKYILILLVKFYRKFISPLKPACCRFMPSCSAYAVEALEKRGAVVGTALAVMRVLRCNPLCAGGYDPVPEKRMPARARRKMIIKDLLFLSDKVYGRK